MQRLVDLAAEDLAEQQVPDDLDRAGRSSPAEPPTNISPTIVISASAGQVVVVGDAEAGRRHHRDRLEDACADGGLAADDVLGPDLE